MCGNAYWLPRESQCLLAVAYAARAVRLGSQHARSYSASHGGSVSVVTFSPPEQFDEFRVVRALGEGAMGQVFLCEDEMLQRPVAVKFLKDVGFGAKQRHRFLNEARAIARLTHANVVTVYRVGEVSGVPFIASEFIEGTSLDKLPLPLSFSEVLLIANGLARGLAIAHERGVLHRDIKPANIMLTAGREVKLLDFGLARFLDVHSAGTADGEPGSLPRSKPTELRASQQASSDTCVGTPLYMAPETWTGQQATPQTDIYSVGAVLYELSAGVPPHVASDLWSLEVAACGTTAAPLASIAKDIHPAFAAIVDRCLCREPSQRFKSGGELSTELESFARSLGPLGRADGRYSSLIRYGGATLALALVGGTVGLTAALRPIDGMTDFAGGPYTMGASNDEVASAQLWCDKLLGSDCDEVMKKTMQREQPQRSVLLSPFRLDRREVTTEEFVGWLNKQPNVSLEKDRFVKLDGAIIADIYPMYQPFAGFSYDKREKKFVVPREFRRRPATQLSWHAAQRYCIGQGKRLPTEAEWEFAARGVEGRRFPWGFDEPNCERSVSSRAAELSCAKHGAGPRDVASTRGDVTPEGVYDLGGNVAEWVADVFYEQYQECPLPCRDPVEKNGDDQSLRVVRGGGWMWSALATRATTRSRKAANGIAINFGFRCAQTVPGT